MRIFCLYMMRYRLQYFKSEKKRRDNFYPPGGRNCSIKIYTLNYSLYILTALLFWFLSKVFAALTAAGLSAGVPTVAVS